MKTAPTRECPDHGKHNGEMGCCPRCAVVLAYGSDPVRNIRDSIMSSSLEALAARLK